MVRPATPAPMMENVALAPAATCDGLVLAIEHVAPTAPTPVTEYVAPSLDATYDGPTPVIGYVAPPPEVTFGGLASVLNAWSTHLPSPTQRFLQ